MLFRSTAEVVTANFAPQTVTWSVAKTAKATVDNTGKVVIGTDAKTGDKIVVTATSTFDSTKSDTCTITVA